MRRADKAPVELFWVTVLLIMTEAVGKSLLDALQSKLYFKNMNIYIYIYIYILERFWGQENFQGSYAGSVGGSP